MRVVEEFVDIGKDERVVVVWEGMGEGMDVMECEGVDVLRNVGRGVGV